MTAAVAAMWIEEGKTSLDDWEALTWSLGWTGRPRRSVASVASTSFMFMFDEVPEPVWKTSTGNSASHRPAATSSAAEATAPAISSSSTPSRALTVAAAPLIRASASMWARSSRCPETGKFSTARCVWARHLAPAGTRTSPMESCSTRKPPAAASAREASLVMSSYLRNRRARGGAGGGKGPPARGARRKS